MELNVEVYKPVPTNVAAHIREVGGFVITSANVRRLKVEIISALQFHVEGLPEDDPLQQGDWQFVWHYDLAALIDCYSGILTQENLARITQIRPSVMRQYVEEGRIPSAKTKQQIENRIRAFAQSLATVSLVP